MMNDDDDNYFMQMFEHSMNPPIRIGSNPQ